MSAEISALDRLEEAGLDAGQSKAAAIGIDELLVKSMTAFRRRLNSFEHSIHHRFDALENLMRIQTIGMAGIIVALLLGFAGLMYVLPN